MFFPILSLFLHIWEMRLHLYNSASYHFIGHGYNSPLSKKKEIKEKKWREDPKRRPEEALKSSSNSPIHRSSPNPLSFLFLSCHFPSFLSFYFSASRFPKNAHVHFKGSLLIGLQFWCFFSWKPRFFGWKRKFLNRGGHFNFSHH